MALLAIPSFLSAFSDSRPPRLAALLLVLAALLVYDAVRRAPEGYGIGDLPDAFLRVVAMIVN
ncbi:hypothetical protein PMES_01178 [Profundibacterium mesophilum KAUST100406-0324]|uniref:Uncharacterized protein n=2 Tax=Profundibacterium TaxID=1258570 RepID=A0A921NPX1_9RHOB|nr:hypothetical protein PMES_01178 [Profundibacterium mesophilum KAUST100406-0324]